MAASLSRTREQKRLQEEEQQARLDKKIASANELVSKTEEIEASYEALNVLARRARIARFRPGRSIEALNGR